jgi:two-component sensor histidine kinase
MSELMKETHHRVKNTLALVASLVSIKESSLEGEVDLSDLQRRIAAVERVHEMLSRSDTGLAVPMKPYLEELLSSATSSVSIPGIESRVSIEAVTLPAKKAVALGIIVNEAVTNAAKHGLRGAGPHVLEVTLQQHRDGRKAVLTVSNSGRPLPQDFAVENAASLGMQLISGLVEQLSGNLEMRSEPQTALVIEFPLSD